MKRKMHVIWAAGFLLCSIGASSTAWGQIPFSSGTLVVVRYGDGSTPLTSSSTPVFLDEYKTDGTLVNTISIPTVASGSHAPLTVAGNAISEGSINRSTDGRYIFLCGYGASVGIVNIASITSAACNRVIARLDEIGTIDITTQLSDAFSGKNIRSVSSIDGSAFWTSGADDGVRYATLGATTSTVVSSTCNNLRVINIFNNQLYVTSGASNFCGVISVGSGVPTITGNTSTLLNGFPTSGASPYGFSISPDGNTIYVADDGNITSGSGGLQKWTYNGFIWTRVYTLTLGLTNGLRGILVDWSGNNPVIYGTDAAVKNHLVVITDNGSSAVFLTLAAAQTNTAFHGLTFSPTNALPVEMTSFTASMQGANNAILQWNTATEMNNNRFEIERRAVTNDRSSEINWKKVGFVAGAGTSNVPKNYSYTDNNLFPGMYVYRIKQIDNDGIFEYSASVQVDAGVTGKNFELLSNYPNPFNPATEIHFSIPEDGYASLKVYNMLGQEVATLFNGIAQSGHYIATTFNAGNIASGVYFSRLAYNGKSLAKKMFLTK